MSEKFFRSKSSSISGGHLHFRPRHHCRFVDVGSACLVLIAFSQIGAGGKAMVCCEGVEIRTSDLLLVILYVSNVDRKKSNWTPKIERMASKGMA
jgi:hypothetical protein